MDAGLQRRRRGRPRADLRARARPTAARRRSSPRRWSSACSARAPTSSTASPALSSRAPATSRRSASSPAASTDPGATPCCPADFVTADDGTGLVHTAIAFGEDDFRLGEQYGLNVINPVRLDGTYDERIGPYAGRWVKDADPDLIEDLAAARPAASRRELRALLPALLALRHAAALLRQALLVHRHQPDQGPAAGRQRDGQLAPRARQARPLRQLARGQRRLGPLARALLGDAAAGVALRGRPRKRDRLAAELERARGHRRSTDPHRPFVDDVTFPCADCGERCAACPR